MDRRQHLPIRRRINTGEEYEVRYWAKLFNVSGREIIDAVDRVGDDVEVVRRALRLQRYAA